MAAISYKGARRVLATVLLAGTAALGAGLVAGTQHAGAQGIPTKTCTGSGASGQAEPGDTLTCVVSIAGALVSGDTISVEPMAPAGATIPANGCVGVTGQGTAPFTYSTTVTETGGACTWAVTATTFGTAGNSVIGSEQLQIPAGTAAGTSVTQQAKQCGPPLPVAATVLCSPFLPMGTSGAGSCVGGTALPLIGGCAPALPLPTPTPSASPTASATGTGTTSSGGAGGVQAASSTPFTSGPEHPLPVAAALVAAGGLVVALLALGGPALLRRRRRSG
jgi:hypothetical protein